MNVLRFDSEASWVQTAAELFEARLRERPDSRLCLPAGNTPLPLYQRLAEDVRRGALTFAQATLFSLDEYGGLAPDDPGRCASMLRRHLLDHIDLPAAHLHQLDTLASDVDEVCRRYDASIGAGLDLTLLGIGRNGHVGLNEPGSAADSATRRVALHAQSTEAAAAYVRGAALPTWGATIGLRRLLESREIWLLARGAAKAHIVERLVRGPVDASVPASLLREHPRCWLFIDDAAASRL